MQPTAYHSDAKKRVYFLGKASNIQGEAGELYGGEGGVANVELTDRITTLQLPTIFTSFFVPLYSGAAAARTEENLSSITRHTHTHT